jgi:drug/metabolite transporter (DMT)-like permease
MKCRNTALLAALIANFLFTVATSIVKLIQSNEGVYTVDILLVSNTARWVIAETYLRALVGRKLDPTLTEIKWVFVAQLGSVFSYFSLFLAVRYVSVSVCMLVQNLIPFVVALEQRAILKEKTRLVELLGSLICFAAIASDIVTNWGEEHSEGFLTGLGLAFCSLLLFSPTYIIPRYFADMDTHHQNVLNVRFGAGITGVFYLFTQYDRALVSSLTWYGFLSAGFCGVIGFVTSLLFIYANQHDLSSRVAALEFSLVVFGLFLDCVLFGVFPTFT